MKNPSLACMRAGGFTLVEVLVATAIIGLLLLILTSITEVTRKTWINSTAKAEEFRGARTGFEAITRRLSQATLNTYWDYFDASGVARTPQNAANFVPSRYGRQSDLRFISGPSSVLGLPSSTCPTHAVFFQAPLGYVADRSNYARMENLLNTWGFFIQFGDDSLLRPAFVTKALAPYRYRFRLMELMEASELFSVYQNAIDAGGNADYVGREWFSKPFNQNPRPTRVLAENVVALVVLPKLTPYDQAAGKYADGAIAPSYLYDSTGTNMATLADKNLNPRHQLPPVIQVTMIAVDEASFSRLQKANVSMPALGLSTLFTSVGDTADPSKSGYAKDLQTLQTTMQATKPALTYRVFSTNVSIKGAKWSREQSN